MTGWTTPRTWTTGEVVTAAELNAQIRDNANAAFPLGSPTWATFTPGYSGWTPGSATVTCQYFQVGKLVTAQYDYVLASDTTFTTNPAQFGLPVAASFVKPAHLGSGLLIQSSSAAKRLTAVEMQTVTAVILVESGGGIVASAVPWAWTTNDSIRFTITFEAA